MNILADSSLPDLKEAFPPPFHLTLYSKPDEIPQLLAQQDVLICRSTLSVNDELFRQHYPSCVATASSGSDHIDQDFLNANGILLLDAKGSNAQAVADYVLSTIAWLQTYKNFSGKKAAVVGIGAVGSKVMALLQALGFEVLAYDPPRAERDPEFETCHFDEILNCDVVCLHANLHATEPYPSLHLLSDYFFERFLANGIIINAARGNIVDEKALLKRQDIIYCTDVYSNEPQVNPLLIDFATLCTPHIAGHSIEAKSRAIHMLSQKIHQYFQLAPIFFKEEKIDPESLRLGISWEEFVLHLYNPQHETKILKEAADKRNCFLSLRQAHQFRHDFTVYQLAQEPGIIKEILRKRDGEKG